jgi:hypothetical protein
MIVIKFPHSRWFITIFKRNRHTACLWQLSIFSTATTIANHCFNRLILTSFETPSRLPRDLFIKITKECPILIYDVRRIQRLPLTTVVTIITIWFNIIRPPLWSSGQSPWLQIRRPGFDSRHYEKKKAGLERGPPSLVSTTEELLDRKVAAPV